MDSFDSDSSDDEYGLGKKALDVNLPEHFDPNSVPQTGEEYLHHVIYERTKKCKKWVTAEGDFTRFNKNQTIHLTKDVDKPKALDKFYPTKEWQENAITDFIQLRNLIKNTIVQSEGIKENLDEPCFDSAPKFSELITLSQATKILLLHKITTKHLNSFDTYKGLSNHLGSWIYGILALLEKPLSPDCCFKLREFTKKCAFIRATLTNDREQTVAVPLNLYICIVARYFNQLDLID
ncbi:hypothetical protein ABEB36_010158 [Hypothenemus hampei]|uniref:Gem-associated protein 2 n=1 Tax=Hypothenemus hampei TaxID=57062 RepID=A0ABD1EIQ6_HYPHA